MRSTKYYVLNKDTGVVEKRSVFGKFTNTGKVIYSSKQTARGYRKNEELQRLERVDGVKIKTSKKDRLRSRK